MHKQMITGLLAGLVLISVAACGNDDPDDDGGTQPSASESSSDEPTTSDEASEEPTDDADAAALVAVADSTYGQILVDGEGMTLYMFDPDAQGESTCYEGCATAWPPLVVDGEPGVGDGADDSKIGTTERTDGAMQVTYDGWPLYYWQNDAAPGDVSGQGVNEVWWVLDADGEPIRTPPTT